MGPLGISCPWRERTFINTNIIHTLIFTCIEYKHRLSFGCSRVLVGPGKDFVAIWILFSLSSGLLHDVAHDLRTSL